MSTLFEIVYNLEEVEEEIKKLLFSFNYKKFYSEYKDTGLVSSNLLFSIILNKLTKEGIYYENISLGVFESEVERYFVGILKSNKPKTLKNKKKVFTKVMQEITTITDYTCILNPTTFSFQELFDFYEDIIEPYKSKLPGLSSNLYSSLEELGKLTNGLIDKLKEHDSPLIKLIESKARGNKKQIEQTYLAMGNKVDNESNILPGLIEESYLDGYKYKDSFYKGATSARNAIMQGTNSISTSGYLNRKICFSCTNLDLSKEVKDCGNSDNYLEVKLTDENYKKFIERWIIYKGELVYIDNNNIEKFKNKKIKLRSPITCKCKDGLCSICYGGLSLINSQLGIGTISATSFAEIVLQAILSTKHLLMAVLVKLNPALSSYLNPDFKNKCIYAKERIKCKIINEALFVEDIECTHSFKEFYYSNKIIDNNGEEYSYIEKGEVLFYFEEIFLNQDLNRALNSLNSLFDKTKEIKNINTYQEYYKKMLEFILSLNIKLDSIHIEVIISQLVRKIDETHKLWRMNQDSDYIILGVTEANLTQGSLLHSMLFERIKESLSTPENYMETDNEIVSKYEKLFFNYDPKENS
jgi:hypothetical protein